MGPFTYNEDPFYAGPQLDFHIEPFLFTICDDDEKWSLKYLWWIHDFEAVRVITERMWAVQFSWDVETSD